MTKLFSSFSLEAHTGDYGIKIDFCKLFILVMNFREFWRTNKIKEVGAHEAQRYQYVIKDLVTFLSQLKAFLSVYSNL